MSQTIVLKQVQIGRAQIEKAAVAELYPGHLVERTSADKVQKHSGSGSTALVMFAIEDENQGKGIDDAYAAAARVVCWMPQRGDQVQAVLSDGENVVIGDYLESNGDGTLKKFTAATTNKDGAVVAQADEALNLSDSSGGESEGTLGYDKRIKVTIV